MLTWRPAVAAFASLSSALILLWSLSPDANLLGFLVFIFVWGLIGHAAVGRWRKPSTILCACVLSTLTAGAIQALTPYAFNLHLGSIFLCLVTGNVFSICLGLLLPRQPLRINASRRTKARISEALRKTPWAGYRLSTDTRLPAWEATPAAAHDYLSLLRLPKGELQLFGEGPTRGMGLITKRALDVLLTLALLPLALPMIAVFSILVRLMGPGPLFYSQSRVTQNGRTFCILKIRSMVVDAEPDGSAVWPIGGDPRITPE
jgi:hypothetical protein